MRCNARSVIVGLVDTDITCLESSAGSRTWARAFATVYEPFLCIGERAGLRKHRKELLERSAGCTVEIGAGTGLNLAHYPDDLSGLVLVEPDSAMRRRLAKRLAAPLPSGAAGRRTGGAAAVPRWIHRHGRLDLGVVHRGRSRCRPA